MNDFFKKICPIAAVVCFVLCIVGSMGIIKEASTADNMLLKSVGLFFTGVSIFVLITLLALPALTSSKPKYKTGYKNDRYSKNGKPGDRRTTNNRSASKPTDAKKNNSAKPQEGANSDNDGTGDIRRDSGEQISDDAGPITLYVCNLSTDTSEPDLREEFGVFGEVKSVRLMNDRETGVSKGYAFVEMKNKAEASLAIDDINGQEIKGQEVKVSYARRKPRYGYKRNYRN